MNKNLLIEELEKLENEIYLIFDKNKEKIEDIIKEIKEKYFKDKNIEEKIYYDFLISEIIASYFSDYFRKEYLIVEFEDLRNKEKLN